MINRFTKYHSKLAVSVDLHTRIRRSCVNQCPSYHWPQQTGYVNQCLLRHKDHSKLAMSSRDYYVTKTTANWPCQPVSITSQRPQQTGHVNQCQLRHKDHSKLAMSTSVHEITGHSKLAMSTSVYYITGHSKLVMSTSVYYVTNTTANWPCQPVSITSQRPQQTGHVNQCPLRHEDHSKLAMSTRVCYDTKTTTNWLCQPMSIITSLATANCPGQPVSITSLATANRLYRSLQHYNSYCKWLSN